MTGRSLPTSGEPARAGDAGGTEPAATLLLPTQVFLTRRATPPDAAAMTPVAAHSWKPAGGLWTSSLREDGRSHWEEWVEENEVTWYEGGSRWLLEPREARVYVVDASPGSLERLFLRFGVEDEIYARLAREHPSFRSAPLSERQKIDWEAFGAEYDALHLTEDGLWAHRLDSMFVYGWDAESTVWLRWCFDAVRACDPNTLRGAS